MKQLIIGKNKAYATSTAKYTDFTTVPEGTLAIFNLVDGSLATSSAKVKSDFCVVLGRGANKSPLHFPEVNLKTLTVTKSTYTAGKTFTGKITIPTTVKGNIYTVKIVKLGVVFNERNKWTFSSLAKGTTAADVAVDIVKQINANTPNLGVSATNTDGAITITATSAGPDYEIIGCDELIGVQTTDVTHGIPAKLDKVDMQDIASRCAAGKGFTDVYADGDSIYPGYPEVVDADKYVMYTLHFAVPRMAGKQTDEVVWQILHIAVPQDSACIATLDVILGVSEPSKAH